MCYRQSVRLAVAYQFNLHLKQHTRGLTGPRTISDRGESPDAKRRTQVSHDNHATPEWLDGDAVNLDFATTTEYSADHIDDLLAGEWVLDDLLAS